MPAPSPIAQLQSPKTSLLKGLKVCFVVGTLGQGGAERQLYYMLRALHEQGTELLVLCLTRGEFWEERIRALGVPVVWVGQKESRLKRLAAIVKHVRTFRPTILQSSHFYTNTYTGLSGWLAGCPSVGAVRNNVFSEVASGGPLFGRLHLHLPRWQAANSRQAIRNLQTKRLSQKRLRYLPNVVDTSLFHPRTTGCDGFTVLGVGRLVRQKRFDLFLGIIGALRTRIGPLVRGVVVGEGPLRKVLEARANGDDLRSGSVIFAGRVADPLQFYHQAKALLLTSDYEGTPNVIMEAMACGLPVVTTKVGGVPDLVKHGENGFLFEPGEIDGAVEVLERLVKERTLATEVGERARKFVEQHHSVNSLAETLAGLYGKVLAVAA